ncbi:MAG: hypothetical protein WD847_06975 [Pirellulales bacterium]|jgi:hypothetical protein
MAHNVTFNVPDRPLGNADVVFTVSKDGEKFGELRISKGAVVWFPMNKVNGYRLLWSQFDRLAQEHGRSGEKRPG